VSIARKDKLVVWLLLLRRNHSKRIPYGPEQHLKVSEKLDEGASGQKIGTEVREGHPTVLYEVTKKQGGAGRGLLSVNRDGHSFPGKAGEE
jgi:hypothetical protein